MTKSLTPELDRKAKAEPKIKAIYDFIMYLWDIGVLSDKDVEHINSRFDDDVDYFFGLDYKKIRAERMSMLERVEKSLAGCEQND